MDPIIAAGCALLVLFGAAMAHAVSAAEFGVSSFKDALEVASYIATIAAAIFAVRALTAWRSQFNHEQKFNVLKKLHLSCDGFFVVRPYMRAYMRVLLAQVAADESAIASVALEEKSKLAEWHAALAEFDICFEDAGLFFNEELQRIGKMKSDLVGFYGEGWQSVAVAVYEKEPREVAGVVAVWNQEVRVRINELRKEILELRKVCLG